MIEWRWRTTGKPGGRRHKGESAVEPSAGSVLIALCGEKILLGLPGLNRKYVCWIKREAV